ncbi:AarF/ABC1/UbiB kinase family protein [Acidothermaceae bacterium B102]|nr:AarF/ABC1/UbiB kinase family protein [Acidothermaceae bacterium B102]
MNRQQARYRQIAQVLGHHGMGYLVGVLGLQRWSSTPHGGAANVTPEHLRLALEELGPTAVKLGQILSTRPDIVPARFQVELAKLQDDTLPVPVDELQEVIAAELGAAAEDLFAAFDLTPLASASIGQAHAAVLADGGDVVVKIRRPGVVEEVGDDLEILHNLAARASRHWQAAERADVVGLVDDFSVTLRAELDYLLEGRNADRFAADFGGDDDVHIPRVYWDTTTSRVLTLERIRGLKVSDLDALDAAGIDRPALAARATRIVADMVFEYGFFHADLHPGNLFIEPDGRIGLIDFGMVGEVDAPTRQHLATLLAAFSRGDPGRVTTALLAVGVAHAEIDRAQLRTDVAALLRRFEGRPLGEIPVGAFVNAVLHILRGHQISLPRQLALLLKMVVMVEGMGALLDPGFRLGSVLSPYLRHFLSRQLPGDFAHRIGQAGVDAAQLGVDLPGHLRRLLDSLDAGGLELHLRARELEPLVERTERIGNRLVAGLITAALIEGIAEVVTSRAEGRLRHEPALLALAGGAATSLTAYLAWTSRRR